MSTGPVRDDDAFGSLAGARRELRALTGLRGFCALFVMVAHYDFRDVSRIFEATFWHNPAVDIFFVLSGFTMFYVHGAEREALDFRNFMARRVARLWPLAVFTFLLALLPAARPMLPLDTAPKVIGFGADVVRQMLMVNCWPVIGSGVQYDGPQWSTSVEFLLYVALFPSLYAASALARRLGAPALAAASFVLMGLSCAFYLAWFVPDLMEGRQVANHATALLSLSLRGACGFTAGYLTYYYCRARPSLAVESRLGDAASAAFLLLILGATLGWWPFQFVALVAPAVVVCNVLDRSLTSRFLSSAPLHHLGIISYSLYLLHAPLLWYVTMALNQVAKYGGHPFSTDLPGRVVTLLVIIPASTLSYRFVEAPARARLHRLLSGRKPRFSGAPLASRTPS